MKKTLLTLAAGLLMAATANAQSTFTYWVNGSPVTVQNADSITFAPVANAQVYAKKGLLITEMFLGSFPNRKSGSQNNYKYDQYIKVGNNSDRTLYLDGVILAETLPDNNLKWYNFDPALDSTKNIIVQAIYRFPGTGNTYPVEPGQEKVIALSARNHKADHGLYGQTSSALKTDSVYQHNSDSLLIDLSVADFEIYDAPAADVDPWETTDEDNPDVVNMDKWYNSSQTLWVLNQHGNLSYVLAMPEDTVTKDGFLKDHYTEFHYHYDIYSWDGTVSSTNEESSLQKAYTLPKDWVIDGINLACDEEARGLYLMEGIDNGYASVNHTGLTVVRTIGKAVVRKQENGKWVDTNNSSNDFTSFAEPTLR